MHGMKVGTDALLLGSWAGSEMTRRGGQIRQALDIGTGSGILALMVAQQFPKPPSKPLSSSQMRLLRQMRMCNAARFQSG